MADLLDAHEAMKALMEAYEDAEAIEAQIDTLETKQPPSYEKKVRDDAHATPPRPMSLR